MSNSVAAACMYLSPRGCKHRKLRDNVSVVVTHVKHHSSIWVYLNTETSMEPLIQPDTGEHMTFGSFTDHTKQALLRPSGRVIQEACCTLPWRSSGWSYLRDTVRAVRSDPLRLWWEISFSSSHQKDETVYPNMRHTHSLSVHHANLCRRLDCHHKSGFCYNLTDSSQNRRKLYTTGVTAPCRDLSPNQMWTHGDSIAPGCNYFTSSKT